MPEKIENTRAQPTGPPEIRGCDSYSKSCAGLSTAHPALTSDFLREREHRGRSTFTWSQLTPSTRTAPFVSWRGTARLRCPEAQADRIARHEEYVGVLLMGTVVHRQIHIVP